MIISLLQLREGRNKVEFSLPADLAHEWMQLVDELYSRPSSPMQVELSLLRTQDAVQMHGDVSGRARFRCARCLEEREKDLLLALDWTLLPKGSQRGAGHPSPAEELELEADDLDVSFVDEHRVDLRELVREAVLLDLAPCPTCEVDSCEGAAYMPPPSSGESDDAGRSDAVDPRWAALAEIKARMKRGDG